MEAKVLCVFQFTWVFFQKMRRCTKEKRDGVWLPLLSLVNYITLDQNIYYTLKNQHFYCSFLTEEINYMLK